MAVKTNFDKDANKLLSKMGNVSWLRLGNALGGAAGRSKYKWRTEAAPPSGHREAADSGKLELLTVLVLHSPFKF